MINQVEILFTGGSGLLGQEIKKLLPSANYPSSNEFNVSDYEQMKAYVQTSNFKILIHAAAFTSPPRIDKEPLRAIEVNISGTANIVKLCMEQGLKLVYISTDYVFRGDKGNYCEDDPVYPVNKYAWSKLGGECAVRLYDKSLIVRTSFGENVFPYQKAFVNQWTSREGVGTFARRLIKLLEHDITGTIHIGGPRRTVYEYARSLNPDRDIQELLIEDVNFPVPRDTSLDCSRYRNLIEKG